jgi:hypothetical protein
MCLKNLATNTLIPIGVATTARTRGSPYGTPKTVWNRTEHSPAQPAPTLQTRAYSALEDVLAAVVA